MGNTDEIAMSQTYFGAIDGVSVESRKRAADETEAAINQTRGKTACRWSVWSERVEGLAKEMFGLSGNLDPYLATMCTQESEAMRRIREKMENTDWQKLWKEKKTMFSYGPEMGTDIVEAQMLNSFVAMAGARRVLEVGMFCGYGAAAAADAGAEVVSLEIDPFLKTWLEEAIEGLPAKSQIDVKVGPALDTMKELDGTFDLVFIDANKSEYKDYVQTLLDRNLLSERGTIIADNTLYCGYPFLPEAYQDAQPARRGFGDAIREFNAWVKAHPQLTQVILPVRDGVSLIRRVPTALANGH